MNRSLLGDLHRVAQLVLCFLLLAATNLQAESIFLPQKLRVCSDPNNLPFSHKNKKGFENKIAALLAETLNLELEYTWFPQRMGFIRNTLKSWSDEQGRFKCDLVMGVPEEFDMSDTTSAYYRSSYALVYKRNGRLAGIDMQSSLLNPNAKERPQITIGAFAPSPSINWLKQRDLLEQAKIYRMMSGDPDYYPGKLIEEDLVADKIDAAIIWGPIAGYFAKRVNDAAENSATRLNVVLLQSGQDVRFDYAIAMGVRRGEKAWKKRIEQTLKENKPAITAILNEYKVPLL